MRAKYKICRKTLRNSIAVNIILRKSLQKEEVLTHLS